MAKSSVKLTTKAGYKNGYEAASANQPCKSPHRVGTASEELWLAGYDAYVNGGKAPETPRKRRTKTEMADGVNNPPPVKRMPESMRMYNPEPNPSRRTKPRKDGWLDKYFKAKDQMKTETDSEILELLHMEVADLEWTMFIEDGPKPSTIWDAYKNERGLNFDRTAA